MAKVILKESEIVNLISEAIGEISYGMARDAFKKAGENFDADPHLYQNKRKFDQLNSLHQHMTDRSRENFDPNMDVIICTDDGCTMLKAGELEDKFEVSGYVEPSPNPIYANQKMVGYPKLKGLLGPMWDGDRIRYESQSVYDSLSV